MRTPTGWARPRGATSGFPPFFRRNRKVIDIPPLLLYNGGENTEGRTAYGFYPLQGLRQDL